LITINKIRVVHLAITPVAGSPWNIVSALNAHTNVEARLVVLNPKAYGLRTFPDDLIWERDREECLSVLYAADVIHLHQWIDPGAWFGQEVGAICARKPCLRQWHSVPMHFAGNNPVAIEEVINSPIPQLVIGQYPERYYPLARVVPNLVPLEDPILVSQPQLEQKKKPVLAWSPSGRESAWAMRWGSKGYPETLPILKRLVRDGICELDVIENVPRDECLRRKGVADIIVDELVTGSYHLSGLEGLAQGKPVLGWLDDRSQVVIREMTGSSTLPWINVHLENAENLLRDLLVDPDLCAAIGKESRIWMERWYNDSVLVQHYVQAYYDLLERPDLFLRARDSDLVAHWRNVRLPDLIWKSHSDRHVSSVKIGWQERVNKNLNIILDKFRSSE
jgi:hypothetical protein